MITFQNTNYKTREITLPEFGSVLISTNKLNVRLLNKNGLYISEKALRIDEQIFYFVEESDIDLPDKELYKLLVKQVK